MLRAINNVPLLLFSQTYKVRNEAADAYHQVPVVVRILHRFAQDITGNYIKLDMIYPQFFDRPDKRYKIVDVAIGCQLLRTYPQIDGTAPGKPMLR